MNSDDKFFLSVAGLFLVLLFGVLTFCWTASYLTMNARERVVATCVKAGKPYLECKALAEVVE